MDCDRTFTYGFEKAQDDGSSQNTAGRQSRISKRYVFI